MFHVEEALEEDDQHFNGVALVYLLELLLADDVAVDEVELEHVDAIGQEHARRHVELLALDHFPALCF